MAGIYRVHQVMVVNPSFPAKTGAEFVAYAKAQPARSTTARPAPARSRNVSGELLKMLAGVDTQHVPYRGAPLALADATLKAKIMDLGGVPMPMPTTQASSVPSSRKKPTSGAR